MLIQILGNTLKTMRTSTYEVVSVAVIARIRDKLKIISSCIRPILEALGMKIDLLNIIIYNHLRASKQNTFFRESQASTELAI